MNRQTIFQWVKQQYHTEPDYPWADRNAVLRHKENNKWYALIMEVGRGRLGLQGDGMEEVLNVKCEPMLIGSLLTKEGFHPAYHMNKDKWITVRLDGSVPEEEIKNLIALSYQMTAPKKNEETERISMDNNKIYQMSFSKVYPLLLAKVENKGRTKAELDEVICWLTGYNEEQLKELLEKKVSYEDMFKNAPNPNENRWMIRGVVCKIRVEEIKEPLMREIRYLDKLVDELARGKAMDKILRKG